MSGAPDGGMVKRTDPLPMLTLRCSRCAREALSRDVIGRVGRLTDDVTGRGGHDGRDSVHPSLRPVRCGAVLRIVMRYPGS